MTKFNINGAWYEYDLEHPLIRDAMMLKTATGMNWKPFLQSMGQYDPECLLAFAWLLLTRAGVKGADGEALKLAEVPDFDIGEFDAVADEPVDPTIGEPSSPNGITADSTSPEPLPTTG